MSMYGEPRLAGVQGGKSLTRQSEAEACDINRIMARYEKTGVIPEAQREGLFVDVSEIGDYRTALEQVRLAEASFAQLPAQVRARFENEPARFLDFMSDEANLAEARELGLVEPEEAPKVPEVPAVVPPA